ncbi:hypothetical protein [Streptomyces sp. NPDC088196]|uniref:hypothetical protein n=1 Tax=Streptomyces sp. NPDC088196 TaxID=3154868 RepID=UPI00344BE53B
MSGPAVGPVNTVTPSHELPSLQGKAGNAGVVQMLSEGGHSWAGRTADPASGVRRAVVQRSRLSHGNISFTNVSLKYPESQGKATRVLELLAGNTQVKSFLADRSCRITLEKRTTETPANVVDKGAEGVFVTMASYYLENYGIGYIVGMLCHEFGMHPMAQAAPPTPPSRPITCSASFPEARGTPSTAMSPWRWRISCCGTCTTRRTAPWNRTSPT